MPFCFCLTVVCSFWAVSWCLLVAPRKGHRPPEMSFLPWGHLAESETAKTEGNTTREDQLKSETPEKKAKQ